MRSQVQTFDPDLEAPTISFSSLAGLSGAYADDAVNDPFELPAVLGRVLGFANAGHGPALVEVASEG